MVVSPLERLNKNATPFVPGPPMTPPKPVNFKRPSPLVLVAPDSDFPSTITPPGLTAFDILGKPASAILET
ncbi:hypothetical protein PtB15_4B463 [Puccinia triticina]|nr:hypothetical protein PtB15_4B463 [Puccinia triticina]